MLYIDHANSKSINIQQSISTLKFKASSTKDFSFCFLLLPNLLKIARQFKVLAILYFKRFIIIFNLILSDFSIPFAFEKKYDKNRYEERAFEHLQLLLYIFHGNFTDWKHSGTIFCRYLKVICLSKSNKNQLILLSQYIKCSNVFLSRY